jgi:glycosyltransferase involved in cell wall biosynthesis
VVSVLTEELVRAGHEVVLAAAGDSTTDADLISVHATSLRRSTDIAETHPYDWAHIGNALERASDCDIIHNHAGELAMAMAPLVPTPMLTTAHCLTTADTAFVWTRYRGAYNTISRSEAAHFDRMAPRARFVGHVYNAIDVDSFPFERTKGDDLLFLSRLAPEKGPEHAIAVAKRLGRRLLLAGKVDKYDAQFFAEVIRPLIDGDQIVYVGEADATFKRELYKSAKCVLMPLTWDEPFGLVMPEAMACGTPVIAFRRGSAPELIVHGKTGFVVDTVEEMADAVEECANIDPFACRAHVAAAFSPRTMARAYVSIYEDLADVPYWARSTEPVPAASAGERGGAAGTLAVA